MLIFLNSNRKWFVFLFFLSFFLLGIFITPDYGVSIDEDNTRIVGFLTLESIFKIFSPEHLVQVNEIIAGQKSEVPNLDIVPSSGVTFDLPMAFLELIFNIEDSRNYFLLRHYFNFLFFFTSVYFFYLLANKRYNSWMIGIFGALFLIITPRIFANGFYNSKDIIFMSLSIINLYLAINILEKQTYKNALLLAIITALTINVRIFGLILLFLVLFFYIINILRNKNNKKIIKPLIFFSILAPFFIFVFWPYLWTNPIENLFYSLKHLSEHSINVNTYYLGQYFFATNAPWHYHLVWVLVTTPIVYLILFFIGFVLIAQRIIRRLLKIEKNDSYTDLWRGSKELQDLIFFLTFVIPIILAIDFGSISYDGWRHLFFIYPSFLLIALRGLFFAKIILSKNKNLLNILILILIFPTMFWMYKNHPYQNIYFNFLAGKNFNKSFEMDFFGTSNKAALEYIASYETKRANVYNLSTTDLGLSKKIMKKEMREKVDIAYSLDNADYLINNYRDWKGVTLPTNFAPPKNFKILHEIKVDGITINTIYKKN